MLEYLKKLDAEGRAYELEVLLGDRGRNPIRGPVLSMDVHGVVLQTSGGPCMVGWQSPDYIRVELL